MAQDRIEKIKLSIGKRAAAFSRAAALKLEIHRLRLEARTLRAEARQTEKEMRRGLSEASEKSYEAWKEKEDWKTHMEEAFQELDTILEQLEGKDISLEDSFALYQKGMELVKTCNSKIDTVEKKMITIQ